MLVKTPKLLFAQRWLKENYSEVETLFYEHVDELEQKIADLDLGVEPPGLTFREYSFILDWETGHLSSAEVAEIFQHMAKDHYRSAARARAIKPLQNFMFKHPEVADYVKHTISVLEADVVPKLVKCLMMMGNAFRLMADIDSRQFCVTWVEQTFEKGQPYLTHEDLPLNQAIRQLDSYVMSVVSQTYVDTDNQVAVFDVIHSIDDRTIHWIFAPPNYIKLIADLFEIKAKMLDTERKHMNKILEILAV